MFWAKKVCQANSCRCYFGSRNQAINSYGEQTRHFSKHPSPTGPRHRGGGCTSTLEPLKDPSMSRDCLAKCWDLAILV